jgi:integrase
LDALLARLHPATEAALWIQLATCCRVGELLKAEWTHLDLEKGTWFIPAGNAKNKDEHTIHLSGFAVEKFKALREVQTSARWMFPASKLLEDGSYSRPEYLEFVVEPEEFAQWTLEWQKRVELYYLTR